MDDRRDRIWPWVLFAILTVGVIVLAQHGLIRAPSVIHRRAVIVNDDDVARQEIEETIEQARKIKSLMDKEKGR